MSPGTLAVCIREVQPTDERDNQTSFLIVVAGLIYAAAIRARRPLFAEARCLP
jgi:hypothetical protein